MDNKDWERLKNFSIYKVPMTDEEMDQNIPLLIASLAICVVVVIVFIIVLFG